MLTQDASLAITYGFADIQHNTFESFIGKPFKDFRPKIKGVRELIEKKLDSYKAYSHVRVLVRKEKNQRHIFLRKKMKG